MILVTFRNHVLEVSEQEMFGILSVSGGVVLGVSAVPVVLGCCWCTSLSSHAQWTLVSSQRLGTDRPSESRSWAAKSTQQCSEARWDPCSDSAVPRVYELPTLRIYAS